MQRFLVAVLILFSLLLLLMAGCAEDAPNAVGIGLLPPKDSLHITSLTKQAGSSSTELKRISGNSLYLLLGRSQSVEARLLLRFLTTSGDFPSARIDSAMLYLTPVYLFKDTIGLLDVSVHLANSTSWSPSTFLWDSVTAGFINDTVAGRFNHTIAKSDTQIAIRLDTSIVRQWLATGAGSVILTPSVATTVLAGFYNSSVTGVLPRFVITYHDTLDTLHTYQTILDAATFVADAPAPSATNRFFTQSAVTRRGLLKFDVSSIPSRATISDAVLEVSVDSALSVFASPRRDSMLVHLNLASTGDSLGFGVLGVATDSTRKTISFQVNTIVQKWVSHAFANNGFVLRNYSEFSGGERMAFFGAGADSLHRPKLSIRYSIVP